MSAQNKELGSIDFGDSTKSKRKNILLHILEIIRNMFYRLIRGEKGLDWHSKIENEKDSLTGQVISEQNVDVDPIPFLKAQYKKYAPNTQLSEYEKDLEHKITPAKINYYLWLTGFPLSKFLEQVPNNYHEILMCTRNMRFLKYLDESAKAKYYMNNIRRGNKFFIYSKEIQYAFFFIYVVLFLYQHKRCEQMENTNYFELPSHVTEFQKEKQVLKDEGIEKINFAEVIKLLNDQEISDKDKFTKLEKYFEEKTGDIHENKEMLNKLFQDSFIFTKLREDNNTSTNQEKIDFLKTNITCMDTLIKDLYNLKRQIESFLTNNHTPADEILSKVLIPLINLLININNKMVHNDVFDFIPVEYSNYIFELTNVIKEKLTNNKTILDLKKNLNKIKDDFKNFISLQVMNEISTILLKAKTPIQDILNLKNVNDQKKLDKIQEELTPVTLFGRIKFVFDYQTRPFNYLFELKKQEYFPKEGNNYYFYKFFEKTGQDMMQQIEEARTGRRNYEIDKKKRTQLINYNENNDDKITKKTSETIPPVKTGTTVNANASTLPPKTSELIKTGTKENNVLEINPFGTKRKITSSDTQNHFKGGKKTYKKNSKK
jgi:hypothetical protein